MLKNPPDGMPRVTPYLFYDDLPAALDWLAKAFGFETRMTVPGPDGTPMHAEMTIADGVIMLGPTGNVPTWQSPRTLGGANTQGLFIYVDDVDAHFARAREAGATVLKEPDDQFWGDRMYTVADPEGHGWSFAQHVKDVPPDEMVPPAG